MAECSRSGDKESNTSASVQPENFNICRFQTVRPSSPETAWLSSEWGWRVSEGPIGFCLQINCLIYKMLVKHHFEPPSHVRNPRKRPSRSTPKNLWQIKQPCKDQQEIGLPGTTNLGEDANHIALVSDVTFKAFTQHGPVSSYIAQKLSQFRGDPILGEEKRQSSNKSPKSR